MSLSHGVVDDGDHDNYPALPCSLLSDEDPAPPSRWLSRDSFDSAASCSAASSSSMYSDSYYGYLAQRQQTSQLLNDYHDYITTIEQAEGDESPPPIVRSPQHAYDGGRVALPRGADPRGPSRGNDPPAVDAMERVRFLELKNRLVQMDLDTLRSSLDYKQRGRRRGGESRRASDPRDGASWPSMWRTRRERRLTDVDNLAWHDGSDEFESDDDLDCDFERGWEGSFSQEPREEESARTECLKVAVSVFAILACLLALTLALVVRKEGWANHDHDVKRLRLPPRSFSPGHNDNGGDHGNPNMSSSSGESLVATTFSRSQGWGGRTYQAAVDFCSSKSLSLCSYSTVCPFGPGSAPRLPNGGFDNVAWISIDDGFNSWVQVGVHDHCLKYEFMHGKPPAWGETGEENEEITSHVVCCPASIDDPSAPSNTETDKGPIDGDRDFGPPPETPAYQKDLEAAWYSSADGWNGAAFEDAREFCASREDRFPCPYEAYCPDGPRRSPAEGGPQTGGAERLWSPIVDEVGNGLVLVGGEHVEGDLCRVSYPEDGKPSEDRPVTHIMCCRLVDEEL